MSLEFKSPGHIKKIKKYYLRNILLKNNQIKIADFGSAIDLSVSLSNNYTEINEYISPEILRYSSLLNLKKENITVKADIW